MNAACFSIDLRLAKDYLAWTIGVVLIVTSTSCASTVVLARAKGDPPERDTEKELGRPPHPPQPAYYALMPVAVALDVATAPIQIPFWLFIYPAH